MRLQVLLLLTSLFAAAAKRVQEWPVYGGDSDGTKYSPLDQINRSNVKNLKVAWIFDTGDFSDGTQLPTGSAFETTPLVSDGVMYVSTPFHRLFALDPETGRVLWQFDPKFDTATRVVLYLSRGVTLWKDGPRKRIFLGDQQGRLFSVDAQTGEPDPQFGQGGMIDLKRGFVEDFPGSQYGLTSPPAVCGGTVITGAWVSDAEPRGPSGDVRGFDAGTGRERWRFHTVPHPGEFGHDTWQGDSWKDRGGLNAWSIMSVDERRRLVFLPLTSPSSDYYGGDRPGTNLFGDSVVALDCATGRRVWHFQTVHHDLWDYDLPAQPVLVTVRHGAKTVDAVAQITKTGFVFLLDRETGEPLFDVEERPVPRSDIPGEQSWPTQPFPVKPPPFARQSMRRDELTNVTPESRAQCLAMIQDAVIEGFPNPERTGCPAHSELTNLAEHPRNPDPSITEHLSCCSPCFKDYMGILADLKRRNASDLGWCIRCWKTDSVLSETYRFAARLLHNRSAPTFGNNCGDFTSSLLSLQLYLFRVAPCGPHGHNPSA